MVLLVRFNHDLARETVLSFFERAFVLALQHVANRGVRVHDDLVAGQGVLLAANLAHDLVTDRRLRLELARAVTEETRLEQRAAEALARALARHFDQAELADARDRGGRAVLLQRLHERLVDAIAV